MLKFPSCVCSKTMIMTPVRHLDLVDRFQQRLHIQMGVHPLCQRHGTGVAYDLLDHGRIHMSLRQHRDAGVPRVMRLVVEAQALHHRRPVAVVVVPVIECRSRRAVEQVLTRGPLVPGLEHRQDLVRDGDPADAVCRLAGDHVEVLFLQIDVLFLQGQQLRNAAAGVDQHQHDLVIGLVLELPQPVYLLPRELVVIALVGISVLVPLDIHVLRVILVADIVLHRVLVQLVEQTFKLLQRGVVLSAGVYDVLEVGQADILEDPVVQHSADLVGRFIAVDIRFGYRRVLDGRPLFVELAEGDLGGSDIEGIHVVGGQHLHSFGPRSCVAQCFLLLLERACFRVDVIACGHPDDPGSSAFSGHFSYTSISVWVSQFFTYFLSSQVFMIRGCPRITE